MPLLPSSALESCAADGWLCVESDHAIPGTRAVSTLYRRHSDPGHRHKNIHTKNLMDNPRVLLAIALSFLVLLIWQAWMEDYGPKPEPSEQATVTESPVVSESEEDLPIAPEDQPPTGAEKDIAVQLPAGQRVEVVTDVFRAVIDTRGGDLREVDLLHYP